MKTLTATLLALGTTLVMMTPAHAAETDKDTMGMDEKMMQEEMKDDGMHKEGGMGGSMQDDMKSDGMMEDDMKKEGMDKDMREKGTMEKDGMSGGKKDPM